MQDRIYRLKTPTIDPRTWSVKKLGCRPFCNDPDLRWGPLHIEIQNVTENRIKYLNQMLNIDLFNNKTDTAVCRYKIRRTSHVLKYGVFLGLEQTLRQKDLGHFIKDGRLLVIRFFSKLENRRLFREYLDYCPWIKSEILFGRYLVDWFNEEHLGILGQKLNEKLEGLKNEKVTYTRRIFDGNESVL